MWGLGWKTGAGFVLLFIEFEMFFLLRFVSLLLVDLEFLFFEGLDDKGNLT